MSTPELWVVENRTSDLDEWLPNSEDAHHSRDEALRSAATLQNDQSSFHSARDQFRVARYIRAVDAK